MMGEIIQEHQEIERLIQDCFRTCTEIGTITDSLGEDSHHLQDLEDLPYRSTIYLKLFRQVALRRQSCSRTENSTGDHAFDFGNQCCRYTGLLPFTAICA